MEGLSAARCGAVNSGTPKSPSAGPAIAKSNFKPHHHIFPRLFQEEGKRGELKQEYTTPDVSNLAISNLKSECPPHKYIRPGRRR
jgi:hypothetical protein